MFNRLNTMINKETNNLKTLVLRYNKYESFDGKTTNFIQMKNIEDYLFPSIHPKGIKREGFRGKAVSKKE